MSSRATGREEDVSRWGQGLAVWGLVLVLAAIGGRTATAQIADEPWPTYGQNLQRTGQSPNAAATGGWTSGLATGDASSPVIGPDGNIYVVDSDGSEEDGSSTFTLKQYDATDGTVLESTSLSDFPEGQPAVTGDTIVVTTVSGGSASLEVFDGLLNNLINDLLSIDLLSSGVDSLSAPTLGNGGRAYVMADEGTDPSTLYAVELSSGSVEWTVSVGTGSTVAPPIIQGDGTVLVAGADGVLYEVTDNGGSGSVGTFYDTGLDSLSAPAIAPDGTVYTTGYTTGGGQTDPTLFSLPPSGGAENWSVSFPRAVTSPAVGPGEVVHVADAAGTVYALRSDGEQKWAVSAGDPVTTPPVVDANGAVYSLAEDPTVASDAPTVQRHDPATGAIEWTAGLGGGVPAGNGIALANDRTAYVSVSQDSDASALHSLKVLALLSTSPAPTQTVARTGDLQFTFSEPMADLTGLADSIVVRGEQSGSIGGTVSGTGTRTLTYTPSTAFAPGEEITVSLLSGLEDTRGAPLDSTTTYRLVAGTGSAPGRFPADRVVATSETGARDVAAGDLDGDGDRDLVVAATEDNTVRWFENDGTGSFGGGTTIDSGLNYPRDVEVADINGDGALDIVAAAGEQLSSDGDDRIKWYANDGSGGFGTDNTVVNSSPVDDARAIDVGDLDGDGDVDVVSASSDNSTIAVHENQIDQGSGFVSSTITGSADDPRSVALGDFENDGDLDVVWGEFGGSDVAWAPNQGDGTFGAAVTINGAASNVEDVAVMDVNRNGRLDVVGAERGEGIVAWYENTGGSFGAGYVAASLTAVESVRPADVDGDGGQDLLMASSQDTLAWVDGTTSALDNYFGTRSVFEVAADSAMHVTAADLDGDGTVDPVAASFTSGTVTWYPNVAPLTVVGTTPRRGAPSADTTTNITVSFNKALDGATVDRSVVDVTSAQFGAVAEADGNVAVNGTDLTFEPARTFGAGEAVHVRLGASIRGVDGIPLDTAQTVGFTTQTGPGSGTFVDVAAGLTGVEAGASTWGDYDGDGDLDLVVTGGDGSDPTATIYENDVANGNGFAAIGAGLTPVELSASAWGDYDGDGDLDLVVTGSDGSNATATIYENDTENGNGFSAIGAGLTGVENGSAAWGDYDGDGDLDLVIVGSDGSAPTATIYENDVANGNGFSAIGAGLTDVETGSAAWGDYDGDGDLDLVVTGSDGSDPTATIYENDTENGNGFVAVGAGLTAVESGSSSWGDYDGDGDLDLAIAGSDGSNATARIYENDVANGNGFTAIGAGLGGVEFGSAAWGDYDGDGALDLVIAGSNGSDPTATIYENDVANGNGFSAIGASLTGANASSVAWGDYNGDGDLDLVITGGDGSDPRTTVYQQTAALQVSADPATSVGPERATLNGTVNPGGSATRVSVGLQEVSSGDSTAAPVDTLRTALESDQSVRLTTPDTLRPSTEYRYQFSAANSVDSLVSGTQTFVTDNVPPTAVNDTAATDEDTAVTIDVLANDRDRGGVLDTSTVAVVAAPNIGATTADDATGHITYTPDPDSNGTDRFDYVVADDSSATDTATVVVDVAPVNDAPVARPDTAIVAAGDTTTVPVLANDSDVEGALDSTAISVTDDPTNGSILAVTAGGITYVPDPNYLGPDSLRYTVDDTLGATSNVAPVRLNVENAALTAVQDTQAMGLAQIGGAPSTARVTVTNTGDAPLTGFETVVSNEDEFGREGAIGVDTLAVGESLELGVRFGPAEAQDREGTLTVRTAEGATAQILLTGIGVSLDLQAGPAPRGEPAPVALTVEGEAVAGTGTLYARPGGAARYQAFALREQSTDPLQLRTVLPDTMVTPRGIDYYAVLGEGPDALTVPAGGKAKAASRPRHLPVSVEDLTVPGTFAPEEYRMVTIPVRSEAGVKSALRATYGPYDPAAWRLARWDPAGRTYREYPRVDTLRPGMSFWLATAEGDAPSIGAGRTVDASAPRRLLLDPGWNQVGNPFGFAVPWDTIRAASGLTPAQVDGPVTYREGTYRPAPSRLAPWTGYFVFNAQPEPDTLVIPPVGQSGGAKAETASAAELQAQAEPESPLARGDSLVPGAHDEAGRYTLRVEAASAASEPRVWVGLWPDARPGRDALDAAQAPPIEDGVRLSVQEEVGGRSVPHAASFKPAQGAPGSSGRGRAWTLRVWRPSGEAEASSDRTITLQFDERGALPEGYQRYVLDLNRGTRITPGRRLTLAPGEERRLKVILGSRAYAERESDGASLSALETALRGGYPNPFTESATLEYVLAEKRDVTLEVYNVLGQRVRTLVSEEQEGGLHRVQWHGENQYGERVGSGVYFYRIEAGGFTETRKLVLVR